MIENKNEFKKVSDFEALYNAYKKSRQGKGYSNGRIKFEAASLDGILQLKKLLESRSYAVSPYNQFLIYEPKKRVIEAGSFKDKIVQHSLVDNVLMPLLSKEFIKTNVAGQTGKGTLFGLDCLRAHMLLAYNKYGYDCWIVKADIKKYYYSIKHQILKDMLQYYVKDEDVWWLCEKFINSAHADTGVGAPLGNQITLVFGLLYLSGLDHFVTGELGVPYYGRYTDDFYLIVGQREYAKDCLRSIQEFVKTLGLELNQKTQIIPFRNGIKYCGFHTYVTKDSKCIRKLTNEKKRAAKRKYKKMAKLVADNKISMEKFNASYRSWKNYISHGNCIKLGYEMDQYIERMLMKYGCDLKGRQS